jgi:hypothetical protein
MQKGYRIAGGMSTRPGPSQEPGEVFLNPLSGLSAEREGLLLGLEYSMVRENPAFCPNHAELMMQHFVVHDILDHISGNREAVQHGVEAYDPFVRRIAPETYGRGPTPHFPRSPRDAATELAIEIDLVEFMKNLSQIDMLSLRTEARASRLCRNLGRPDHAFVTRDEGSQEVFLPDGRVSNERGKRSQHLFRRIKKHLMKPNRAGSFFPPHRDHRSGVVRESERQRDVDKFPEL